MITIWMRTSRPRASLRWVSELEASPKSMARRPPAMVAAPPRATFSEAPLTVALSHFKQMVVEAAGALLPGPGLEALGPKGQRETTAAFVEAAALTDLAAVRRALAEGAERSAVLSPTASEKRTSEAEALAHWLDAARHESPKQWSAHRMAHLSADRLAAFAPDERERRLFEGVRFLLDDRLDEARASFEQAGRPALMHGVDDIRSQARALELVRKLAAHQRYQDPKAVLTSVIDEALALGERAPQLSTNLLSVRLEAELLLNGRSAWEPRDDTSHPLLEIRFAPDDAHALARARVHARERSGEHAFLATIAEAELSHRLGDLEGAVAAAERARSRSGSPERRGLTALLYAAISATVPDPAAWEKADRVLGNALSELDYRGAGLWEQTSHWVSRLTKCAVWSVRRDDRAFDPNPSRAPTRDMQRVIDELLLARAALALRRGRPLRAQRSLVALKPLDFETSDEKERLLRAIEGGSTELPISRLEIPELARAVALVPLAKAATVPLSLVLDAERFGPRVGRTGALDPMGMRLAFARADLGNLPPTPESLLSAVGRRAGSALGIAIDSLVQSKQHEGTIQGNDVRRERDAFRRARARELADLALAQVGLHSTRPSKEDARTVALGLSRPGEARDLERLSELFGDRDRPLSSMVRPQPKDLLQAATRLGRAAGLLSSPAGAVELEKQRELFGSLASAIPAGVSAIDEARSKLQSLGFVTEQPGEFQRGKQRVQLEPVGVGTMDGYSLAVGPERLVRIAGLTFEGGDWELFEHGRERELARYRRARHRTPDPERLAAVRDSGSVRRFIALRGRPVESMGEKRSQLRELSQLEQRAMALLATLRANDALPKAFYIMVDGIDAASKTSNGLRFVELLEAAGYLPGGRGFKARTEEEQREHYLARFDRMRPKAGRVFFADRSPLGDFAYRSDLSQEDAEHMAEDFLAWQRSMEDQGIVVLKLLFYPGDDADDDARDLAPLWRPMFTFGKREGRVVAATDLAIERRARGEDDDLNGLIEAGSLSPGINDLRSFYDGVQTHQRFQWAADLTAGDSSNPWLTIETLERHDGRVAAMKALIQRLERLVEESAALRP